MGGGGLGGAVGSGRIAPEVYVPGCTPIAIAGGPGVPLDGAVGT